MGKVPSLLLLLLAFSSRPALGRKDIKINQNPRSKSYGTYNYNYNSGSSTYNYNNGNTATAATTAYNSYNPDTAYRAPKNNREPNDFGLPESLQGNRLGWVALSQQCLDVSVGE